MLELSLRVHTTSYSLSCSSFIVPPLSPYEALPKSGSSRLIDFDQAQIVTLESFPLQYSLHVSGIKPYLNMQVDLVPLVYIHQPEYWGIEVGGRLPGGIELPATAPYTAWINLRGITGTEGIEVMGATRSEKLEEPPKEKPTYYQP